MKKLVLFAAMALFVAGVKAATIAWSAGGVDSSYGGNAYLVYILNQGGVDSIESVTTLLDNKDTVAGAVSKAIGTGNVAANGMVSGNAGSEKTVGVGTYTSFMILFNDDSVETSSAYVVLSGAATQTRTVGTSTPSVTFAAGNVSSKLSDANNWKTINDVPEPTSGLLLLIGGALMSLRRKQK